jgi:hypothetical protein
MIFSVWGMQLTWLYASASFITLAGFNRPFPLAEGIAASALAMALTAFTRFSGWRRIRFIAIQLLGFSIIWLRLIYACQHSIHSFFSRYWFIEFLNQPTSWLQWFFLFIASLWLVFFWVGGFKIVTHPKDFYFVRNRFDMGMGVFLAILLIELLVIVKSGIHLQGLITGMLMFPFFIFGLLAFALVRSSGQGQRHFGMGYQGIGAVLSFTAAILLAGSGMVMLFLPHLTRAAEVSLGIIKTAAHPLGRALVQVLLFIFGNRNITTGIQETPEQSSQPGLPALAGGTESIWRDILGWALLGMLALLVLALLLFISLRLLRWLFSRQPNDETASNPWKQLIEIAVGIWRALLLIQRKLTDWVKGPQTAVQLYAALVGWGHFSGMPHVPCETPLEYGSRLAIRFPHLENDIQRVIRTHSETVYGADENNEEKVAVARSAFRRLRTPRNWPTRIKSLLKGSP